MGGKWGWGVTARKKKRDRGGGERGGERWGYNC